MWPDSTGYDKEKCGLMVFILVTVFTDIDQIGQIGQTFQTDWNVAITVLIYKKSNRKGPSNYKTMFACNGRFTTVGAG